MSGFFAAFAACNELPAAAFGVLMFGSLLVRFPGKTLVWFAPAAALPCAAFLGTLYLATAVAVVGVGTVALILRYRKVAA